jgi:hypothetical protein
VGQYLLMPFYGDAIVDRLRALAKLNPVRRTASPPN